MLVLSDAKLIKAVMRSKNYLVFGDQSKGGYDLNIFGIRTLDNRANTFNDVIGVMYLFNDRWNCFMFPATTDPGVYYREHPMNVNGTAILVPGQYRGAFKLGLHSGYPALVQKSPLKVYRDNNKDEVLDLDPDSIQEGMFGINLHHAGSSQASTVVDKWSAGCQVVADPFQHQFLYSLAKKSSSLFGDGFTYTLLEEADF